MKQLMSWRVIVSCLIVGAMSLPVGLAMMNGWNPYDLAPGLQWIQAAFSFFTGVTCLGVAAVGVMARFIWRRNG